MKVMENKGSTLLLVLAFLGAVGVPYARRGVSQPGEPARGRPDAARAEGSAARVEQTPGVGGETRTGKAFESILLHALSEAEGLTGSDARRSLGTLRAGTGSRPAPRPAPRIDSMIVTVPNPDYGHLAVYFDQSMDAIVSAAAAEGYFRETFWFPWTPRTDDEGSSAGHEKRSTEVTFDDPEAPGFVVFSRRDERQLQGPLRLLVVFVVGESPVHGIAGDALLAALEIGAALHPEQRPLVLGPFFTGAARSLGQALRSFQQSDPRAARAVVVTGAATGSSVAGDLDGTDFSRRVATDQHLFEFVARRLAEESASSQVAVLAETDTIFGADFVSGKGSATTDGVSGAVAGANGPVRIHPFSFPLHVAELRAARGASDAQDPRIPNLGHTLELKFGRRDGEGQDLLPAYSNLTTFEVEVDVRETLATISRLGAQYLVIVATDVTDLIFLAREAHQYCPGVQLVTLEADQLLTHPDLLSELSGMLVGSTYPLFLENQRGYGSGSNQPELNRKLFSSETAEGVYNGALDLFARMENSGGGPSPAALDDVPVDGSKRGNQMWLSRVANGRFWPIATAAEPLENTPPLPAAALNPRVAPGVASGVAPVLAAEPTALQATVAGGLESARVAGQRLALIRPTYYADGVTLLLMGGALVYLWLVGRRSRLRWGLRELLRSWNRGQYALPQRQYLAASLIVPAILGAIISIIAWKLTRPTSPIWHVVAGAGALIEGGLLVGAGATFASTIYSAWIRRGDGFDRRCLAALVAGVAMISLAGFGWRYVCFIAALEPTRLMLTLIRIGDPFGVCPVAPLLYIAAGFFVWATVGLSRVRCIEQFPDRPPLPECTEIATPRLSDLMKRLGGPERNRIVGVEVLVALLFVVPGTFFFLHVLPSFEGREYDVLFRAAYLTLYGTVLLAFAHFVILTGLLRTFQRRMAALPMVEAYDRLALKVTGTFGFQLHARVPEASDLDVARLSATALGGLATQLPAGASDEAAELIRSRREDLVRVAGAIDGAFDRRSHSDDQEQDPDPGGAPRSRRRDRAREEEHQRATLAVHVQFFTASSVLFEILSQLWRCRARSPHVPRLGSVSPGSGLVTGESLSKVPTVTILAASGHELTVIWQRLAEDFVAMRVATFVIHVLGQIRALMVFALTASLLLVASIVAYPFHPSRFITVFTWTLVIVVVAGCLISILDFERNEVLSRLAGTEPGRINLRPELLGKIVLYVVLPLVGLLAALFPEVADLLLSWIEPLRNLLP
jgi:hypothetical protein